MSEVVATAQQGLAGNYHPYPEYKDSGVEWLDTVPSHWDAKRLGQFLFERREKVSDKDYAALSVTKNGILPQLDTAAKSDAGDNRKLVKTGDFVINSRSDRKGSSGISERDGSVSLISIVMEPKGINHRYIHHLLRSYPFQEEFYRWGKGIVADLWSTNYSEMKNIILPIPTDTEQRTIAAFLDYETSQIDRLISLQQRLIELLKEKRQAVISHAVTKGLNPNAPMKDSGVEWLGQVPEHWQCVPFGLLVSRADLGGNYLGGQEENGIPFLKMGNLGRGCIVLDKLECLEDGSNFDNAHRLSMGDFLFNTRNSLDLVGKVAVWHDELEFALYNSNLLRVRFKKDFISSPDFMGFVFNSSGALGWLALLAKGTTSVAAIYYKDLRSMVVPIPPVDEQNAISSFISKCLSRLDTLEKKAIQSINLMNERRTALISAAVTGKIDLRGWTTPADEVAV